MILEADTAEGLYRKALRAVLADGEDCEPRGMKTKELRGAILQLNNPPHNIITGRSLNYRFMAAEFVWLLTGQTRVDLLTKYNSVMARYSDDGDHLSGSYGPMIADQLPWVIEQIRRDPDTRQAVLTIWRPRPAPSKDVPCTIMYHFLLRDGALEMVAYMRSNDLWLGFPYDVFNFTMIQRYVADALGVGVGPYRHMVGSLHIYEQHYIPAQALTESAATDLIEPVFSPTYPYPIEVVEALAAAPNYVDRGDVRALPGGWGEIIGLLDPHYTTRSWLVAMQRYGVEPKWGEK